MVRENASAKSVDAKRLDDIKEDIKEYEQATIITIATRKETIDRRLQNQVIDMFT